MKSIIASLFTIYQLTTMVNSNRLLLQGQPQFIPDPPQATPKAVVTLPNQAAAPAAPGGPAAAAPGTTWTPVTLPPLLSYQVSTKMDCLLTNTNPLGCAGRATTMENAGQNFKLNCEVRGACATSQFTFNYGPASLAIERIESISFGAEFSGYQANIRLDSTNSPRGQYLDKLECKEPRSCEQTRIECIGGSSVNDINCARPEYCSGCEVFECEWGPQPADPLLPKPLLCGTGKSCFFY